MPVRQPVTRYLDATGNTSAVDSTDLVARVQGFVQAIHYKDGDRVAKGAPLFTIEPEPYELKLKQSQAGEAAAKATLTQAEADYQRQIELASRQVASKVALDNATANRDSARANLQQAEANTRLAAINLDYTRVMAPFDGIVTARKVSVGGLVGSGSPTVLATIVQLEPIHVDFNISEQDVLRARAELARRGLTARDVKNLPVEIGAQTDAGYPLAGHIDYAAPSVDPSTGTLAVRAVLANADRLLLPGYFVRVRIPLGEAAEALLVPDTAVGSGQAGRYVLVAGRDDIVEQRNVEIGRLVGDLRVIEKGLAAEDRVIVGGVLRAIAGQKVDPRPQGSSNSSASAVARSAS